MYISKERLLSRVPQLSPAGGGLDCEGGVGTGASPWPPAGWTPPATSLACYIFASCNKIACTDNDMDGDRFAKVHLSAVSSKCMS